MTRRDDHTPGLGSCGGLLAFCLGGALVCGVSAFVMMELELWPFHDESKGFPGVPSSLGYALGPGTSRNAILSLFFAFYGLLLGLLLWIVASALAGRDPGD